MLLGTTVVPLVLQNTTQLIPTRVVNSVCQRSTIVLSVSSTIITAVDDTVSTSYSIFPVGHYASQATGFSTAIFRPSTKLTGSLDGPRSPDVATRTLGFSSSSVSQSRGPFLSESSQDVVFSPTLISTPPIISGMSLSTTSSTASMYRPGSIASTQAGSDSPTGTTSNLTLVSQSSMSTVLEQAATTRAASTGIATATAEPVYTCTRDNGMYYSDTTNRVYQLLCNTDELDATLGTTYQLQLQSCVDTCSDIEGCIGVSYTPTSGLCSYKRSALDTVGSETSDSAILTDYICPGADGTRLVDSSGSVYEILCNTFFPSSSNITSSSAIGDLASCSEICSDIEDCLGFTFQNGSCTSVSSRNANNGVTQMNVTTAILLAKRVAQVVSSGITPYRSTSSVQSLPVDVSRTPSATIKFMSATSTPSIDIVQESSDGLVTLSSTIITSSSTNAASGTGGLTSLPSSADALPSSTDTEPPLTLSSSVTQNQAASSTSSSKLGTSALAISGTLVVSTTILTKSGTPTSSTGASASIPIDSSTSPQSFTTSDASNIVNRSSQGPTVVLSMSVLGATQSSSLSTISRTETSTNKAILSSVSPPATQDGESVVFRPTLVTSQISSVLVDASSFPVKSSPNNSPSEIASSSGAVFLSTVSAVSYSTVSAAAYFAAPSSLPPETNYSCPAVNGEWVQANTGGSYTIGCDRETTGYDTLVTVAPDFNDCMTYCDQLSGCAAWTFDGSCYFKTGTSASNFSFQPSTRGAVSGIRAVPAGSSGESSATNFVNRSFASTTSGSVEPTSDELGVSSTVSATPPSNLPSAIERSTTVVLSKTSVQSSEFTTQNTIYQSTTTQLLSSEKVASSNLVFEETSIATTSDLEEAAGGTVSAIGPTGADGSTTLSLSYPTSIIFSPSVTDYISSPTNGITTPSLTTTNTIPASTASASPSTTCSVYDNLLDICLDAAITPSVGVGGAVSVALGSSFITIIDTSTSLGIAPSAAAGADFGISVGTGGVQMGASASIGVSPGIGGSSQPTTATSVSSTSCSAGGNALNVCIDAAVTPSIGIGGNAGIAMGSSTLTQSYVSASLAIAPSLTEGLDIGFSTDTSGIALIASATLNANLGMNSITVGTSDNAAPTTTANCSAGGNILNVCVGAAITASANASPDLDLGPSSSALTLLDASLALAPSVSAGLGLGLSVGSSGTSYVVSSLSGASLSLSAGLNLGAGQSTATSTLAPSLSITTISTELLPTSSLALAAGLDISSGRSSSSASSVSYTSSRLLSVSNTTSSSATSTATRASSTSGFVQSLTGALGRKVTYPIDSPNRYEGFTTVLRTEHRP